tara:strand:+ start:134 stop:397 length:264 start_codon:yes stop_codon:yes gene_type:complete
MRITRTQVKIYFQRSRSGKLSAERALENVRNRYPNAKIGGQDYLKISYTAGNTAFNLEDVLSLIQEGNPPLEDLREIDLRYRVRSAP